MPNTTAYKLLEACREPGCPVCRLEQQGVERYLDNHFYENVNSPAWRDRLRLSLGFCREHAWLGVDERLGDALGYAIIYHDLVNTILNQTHQATGHKPGRRRWAALLGKNPEQGTLLQRMVQALTPHYPCPVCEYRQELTHTIVSALAEELKTPEMREALRTSQGLCFPHLRLALEHTGDRSAREDFLTIHVEKLERLRSELALFIRKNDYQLISEGFGKEGDAWLRAVALIAGSRKKT